MKSSIKRLSVYLMVGLMCLSLAACASGRYDLKASQTAAPEAMSGDLFYTANGSATGSTKFDYAADKADKIIEESAQLSDGGSSVYRDNAVKLIRRAELTVQTTEFDRAVEALERIVIDLNGYYESAGLRGGSYYDQHSSRSGNYVIRIPAENYDAFMQQVDGVGYLACKNESTEDIGELYYDIETRLKTQRTKQTRLLELLERAESMEDIIFIENALTEVEYHIERHTSDLNRYDGLVSYATIQLSLDEMVKIVDEPGEKAGLFARMKAGVVSSALGVAEGVQALLVWFTYHLFGLMIFAACAVGVVIVIRRSVKKRKQIKSEKSDEKTE